MKSMLIANPVHTKRVFGIEKIDVGNSFKLVFPFLIVW